MKFLELLPWRERACGGPIRILSDIQLTVINTTERAPNCQVTVEIKVLTLDALSGSLAPHLDHLICNLRSLSKIEWILYNIDFLPCDLLFTFFLMHSVLLGFPGLWNLSLLCVTGEMIKGMVVFMAVPVFPLLAELLQAESVTPIVSRDEPRTDWMSSCERNLTHLCALALHGRESTHLLALVPWMGSLRPLFEGSPQLCFRS